jgi:hypothetical protein
MSLKIFTLATLACWLAITAHPHAAVAASLNSLIQAAYFSEVCRQDAEAIGISYMPDANALFAAFEAFERRVSGLGDDRPDARLDDCKWPAVFLINLLRLNGFDAELVFASLAPANAAAGSAALDKIDRVLVYVAALDRYVDPAAPLGKQAVLDQIIRERAKRVHLQGPSLAGNPRGACSSTCMLVYSPSGDSAVRVKTEVIRGR